MEGGLLEYETAGEFLAEIKKKFGGGDKKTVKVVELKRLEQEEKTMRKFIQNFRRAVRGSEYKGRSLVEKFKREMNGTVCQKLIKLE